MQGWMSMIAASAVLSAGLVAGLAAADAASAPAPAWIDPPVRQVPAAKVETPVAQPAEAKPVEAKSIGTGAAEPACRPAAWPHLPAGCSAQGRAVRVIALTQR